MQPLDSYAGEEQDGAGLVVHGHLGDGVVEVAGALGGELTVEGGDGLGGCSERWGWGRGPPRCSPDAGAGELDAHVLGLMEMTAVLAAE